MGRIKGKQLVYPGKIDHGFDEVLARHLQARIREAPRPTPRQAQMRQHGLLRPLLWHWNCLTARYATCRLSRRAVAAVARADDPQ
jgi:hypothetical protein